MWERCYQRMQWCGLWKVWELVPCGCVGLRVTTNNMLLNHKNLVFLCDSCLEAAREEWSAAAGGKKDCEEKSVQTEKAEPKITEDREDRSVQTVDQEDQPRRRSTGIQVDSTVCSFDGGKWRFRRNRQKPSKLPTDFFHGW